MSKSGTVEITSSVRRFKPYPAYKVSGVEWLREMPQLWKVYRAKTVMREVNEPSSTGDETLLSVSEYTGVRPREESLEEGDHLTRADSLEGYKRCSANDLVMNIMLAWKRGQGVAPLDGIVSPAYAVYRLQSSVADSRFIHYLVRSDEYVTLFGAWSYGVIPSRWRLYPEVFLRLPILLPPVNEQRTIAAVLDRETERIDQLIAKKERQIELLHEKRSALISHTVTKSLNPKAKMKASGIEWLGEIPEHWEVKKLGKIAISIQTGPFGSQLHASDYVEDGIPVINPANLQDGEIIPDPKCAISDETFASLSRHVLKEGDIVFARRGEMGRCAIVTNASEGFLCGTGSLRLRVNTKVVSPLFLSMYLGIGGVRDHLLLESVGSTMDNLNTGILARIPIAVPSVDEQLVITQYILTEQQRMRAIAAVISRSVEKLQEYRTALISAAVTGKIDVREEAA